MGYKDKSFDSATGRRHEVREADYTINGDLEVTGDLTQNGSALGAPPVKATGVEVNTGLDDAKFVTPKAIRDSNLGVLPKRYVALLTQSGTDAPVATVLENSLGGIPAWSYTDVGVYRLTLTGAFPSGKTIVLFGPTAYGNGEAEQGRVIGYTRLSANAIEIVVLRGSTQEDDRLVEQSISIFVYP